MLNSHKEKFQHYFFQEGSLHDWFILVYFPLTSLFFSLHSHFLSCASLHSFHLTLACTISHVPFLTPALKLCLFCVLTCACSHLLALWVPYTCFLAHLLSLTHRFIHSFTCSFALVPLLPFSYALFLMLPLPLLCYFFSFLSHSHSCSLPHVSLVFPSLSHPLAFFLLASYPSLRLSLCNLHPCPHSTLSLALISNLQCFIFNRQKIFFCYSAIDQRLVTQNSSITRDNTALWTWLTGFTGDFFSLWWSPPPSLSPPSCFQSHRCWEARK